MMEAITVATIAPMATVIAGVRMPIMRWIVERTALSRTSARRLSINPS
jgi:hypothetical protein